MAVISLTIKSAKQNQSVEMKGNHLTLGSGVNANIRLLDPSLAKIHASIHQENNHIWLLDEHSPSSSFVNNMPVPPQGLPLNNGDQIKLGKDTFIDVTIKLPQTNSRQPLAKSSSQITLLKIISLMMAGITIIVGLIWIFNQDKTSKISAPIATISPTNYPTREVEITTTPTPEITIEPTPIITNPIIPMEIAPKKIKLYQEMSEAEKLEFIDHQAQHIAMMMGNRPYAFTDEVLLYIKKYVDGYAQRSRTTSTKLWGENLPSLYGRASHYVPDIIKAFNGRGIPPVVGIYIVMIETEYHDCLESPVGAKGLFQFMPETARAYGVDPSDRCDVKKMSPAAAHYMADRITEFGPDAMSVALGIAGYNRSPDSVRRDLHDVINSNNRERSFWTLVANSTKLDRPFQNENIKYVPKFFAAAIVGETPWAFGLNLKPLSTYSEI